MKHQWETSEVALTWRQEGLALKPFWRSTLYRCKTEDYHEVDEKPFPTVTGAAEPDENIMVLLRFLDFISTKRNPKHACYIMHLR